MTDSHEPIGDSNASGAPQAPWDALKGHNLNQPQPEDASWERFTDASAPEVATADDDSSRWSKLVRRVGVPLAGAGLLAGAAIASIDLPDHPKRRAGHEHVLPHAPKPHPEIIAGLPLDATTHNPQIDQDFKHALLFDTCETKVSFNEVATMYNRAFGPTDLPQLTVSQLKRRADEAASQLTSDRENLNMVPLPESIDKLRQDAFGPRKIPVREYQAILQQYVQRFGVKAYFSWSDIAPETADLSPFIKQLPAHSLEKNSFAREAIVRAMEDFADMPPVLVQEAGLKRLLFGKILVANTETDRGDLGQSEPAGDSMLIDINYLNHANVAEYGANSELVAVTVNHEAMHLWDFKTCLGIAGNTSTIDDPAYNALNRTFRYDRPHKLIVQNRLANHGSDQVITGGQAETYTTLQQLPFKAGQIVTARAYGAANEDEDKAVTFGETVLNVQNAETLYQTAGRDPRIVQEKVALLLARVYKRNPQLADFYVHVLQGSRVRDEADQRMLALGKQLMTGQITSSIYQKDIQAFAGITHNLDLSLGTASASGSSAD